MNKDHPFFEIFQSRRKSEADKVLLQAILQLGSTVYPKETFDEIYDILLKQYDGEKDAFKKYSSPKSFVLLENLHRIEEMVGTLNLNVIQRMNSMEKLVTAQNNALDRLQTDANNLRIQLAALQNAQEVAAKAQELANERLLADIAKLRDAAGSGNADQINAICDSLETTAVGFKGVADALAANAAAEDGVDPAPAPVPEPTPAPEPTPVPTTEVTGATTLVTNPTTAKVRPGETQQFTANQPVVWSAAIGSITPDGLYTAPTTGTSDTVLASTVNQSATMNIEIG